MSDYKRFVAYLYEYQNQAKGENRGFVRVEARNGTCQMGFQLKVFSLPEGAPLNVYGFVRIRKSLFGIPIGILHAGRNGISGRLMTPSVHIGDSGFSLNELGGLILFGPENRIYATQWDDIPIQPGHFTTDTAILQESPVQQEVSDVPEEIRDNPPEPAPDEKTDSAGGAQAAEETHSAGESQPSDETHSAEELHIASVEAAEAASALPSPADRWQALLDSSPHIHPFDDDEITECLKIDLKDLPYLRKNGWQIGSNQFLLHGFYNYHHLLMGRLTTGRENTFVFGVPGIFDVKEQFMAGMFGFSAFKPARTTSETAGMSPFGYWYRPVQ